MGYPPRPEELLQKQSQINRNPKWPFGTRALLERVHREAFLVAEGVPHAGRIADPHRDQNGKFGREPAFSFGAKEKRAEGLRLDGIGIGLKVNNAPGPGGYAVRHTQSSPRAPSYGFGGAARGCPALLGNPLEPAAMHRGIRETPGPAAYSTRRPASAGPKYSMNGGRSDLSEDPTPSPAQYRPQSAPMRKGPTFGRTAAVDRRRPRSACRAGPGPGMLHGELGGKGSAMYSMRSRVGERPPSRDRPIPHNYTQFGY